MQIASAAILRSRNRSAARLKLSFDFLIRKSICFQARRTVRVGLPISCVAGAASTDGWCPFSFSAGGEVFCVVNGQNAADAPSQPITSLQQITVTGAAESPGLNDSISVSTGDTFHSASGDNFLLQVR